MKVSIVIPVYNKAAHVARSVTSALEQTHRDIEVIAVDDGSTDASAHLLRSLCEKYAHLDVVHQPNRGLSAARNTGIDRASGEWIMFHDADDVLELNAVETLLAIGSSYGSDVVGGVFMRHTADYTRPVEALQHDDYAMNFRADTRLAEKYCTNFSCCNKLFRLEFLREREFRFTSGLYMQDIEFWLKLMFASDNISQTHHIVSNYYAYPDSHSRSRSTQRFESLFVLHDRVAEHFSSPDRSGFAPIANHALIQGAFRFFANWKLEDYIAYGQRDDLDRLRLALQRVPATDFVSFLERNRGPTAAILLLVRSGKYAEAGRLLRLPYAHSPAWRNACVHLRSAPKLTKFALSVGDSSLRNRIAELRYVTPVLARDREWRMRLLRHSAHRALGVYRGMARIVLRRAPNAVRRRWVRVKIALFPVLGPLRDRILRRERSPSEPASPPMNLPVRKDKCILVFGLGDIYQIGGVQLSYQRLFGHLTSRGHSIAFYSHRKKPEGTQPYYTFPAQVSVAHYLLEDSARSWKAIREIAERESPDCILIVNSGQPALILAAALYDLPYPVVYSERGGSDYTLEHNWCSQMQRELTHYASDMAHVLMPRYTKSAPDCLVEWVRVIPSVTEPGIGIADVVHPDGAGRFSVLYTGRLAFEKDLHLLIEAFARVADEFPDWDVRLIGNGPEEAALVQQVERLGLADRVVFAGALASLEAVFEAYLKAHLFVLPSRAEGCPLSLREAMAHGLPVIGFESCSGTNDIIVHGTNGLLAQSDDKVAGLEHALRALMSNADARKTMGRQGMADVCQYAADVIHAQWERLLLDAAQWKGRRAALRDIKRSRDPTWYEAMGDTLAAVCRERHARNIVAYRGAVRNGDADAGLIAEFLIAFGSSLFDGEVYYARHLEVKLAGHDPLEHYLTTGWRHGYEPCGTFDLEGYVRDVMGGRADRCPLLDVLMRSDIEESILMRYISVAAQPAVTCDRARVATVVDAGLDFDAARVARALRQRIDWRPFTRDELHSLRAGPMSA